MKITSLYTPFLCIMAFALCTSNIQAMNFNKLHTISTKKMVLAATGLTTIGAISGAVLYYFYTKKHTKIKPAMINKEVSTKPQMINKETSSLSEEKESEKIIPVDPYKKIPSVLNIKIFGGKNNYEEYVDITEKCPIAQTSFEELITTASEQKRPFILVVAKTKGSEGEKPVQHSYFSAPHLCQWLFERNTFKRKSDLPSNQQHPTFNKEILFPLKFYTIDSLSGDFRCAGDETIFTKDSEESLLLKFHLIAGSEDGITINDFGLVCYNNKNTIYAERAWKVACEKYDNGLASNNLGFLYCSQNKLDLAKKHYLLAIDKHNIEAAMYNLGVLYFNQKKLNTDRLAEKYFLLAIDKHNNVGSLSYLGSLYLGQNKLDLAEKYLLLAAEKHHHSIAANDLGVVYYKLNKLDLAKKWFLHAFEKHSNIQAIYNLGIVYKNMGRKDEARLYLQMAFDNGYLAAALELSRL